MLATRLHYWSENNEEIKCLIPRRQEKMNMSFTRSSYILCYQCGSEIEVVYTSFFKKLVKKLKYCPYCGHKLSEPVVNALVTFEETTP